MGFTRIYQSSFIKYKYSLLGGRAGPGAGNWGGPCMVRGQGKGPVW